MGNGRAAAIVLSLFIVSACFAPGSMIGRVGVAGSIDAPSDRMPQSFRVTLPGTYGLGGLDEVFGKPQYYGHQSRTVLATVTRGEFSAEFDVGYHATFWLIPPVGPIPKHPPPPYFALRFPDAPDEVYLVGVVDDRIKYKVFDANKNVEIQPQDGTWLIEGRRYEPTENGARETWYLHVGLARNAS